MASPMASCPNPGLIMIVEDPFVRRYVKRVLGRGGHEAVETDPGQALKMVRDNPLNIKLVITNKPGLFRSFAKELSVLYLAAFPDPAQTSGFREVRVLRKPFRAEDLLHAVGEMARSL
jgi:hypothetical protein